MTRVTFLHGAEDRLAAAARWLTLAWGRREQVLVYAPGVAAERVDRLLWTQNPTGFVPHCFSGDDLAAETPIVIAGDIESIAQDGCLLNLADTVPPGFARFEHLIEIVSGDDAVRMPARERFRFYRERGYAPESIDVREGLADV